MNKITRSIVAALMLSSIVVADEVKQSINFGFLNTAGNTDTLSLNGKYLMSFTTITYGDEALKVAFDTSAFITESNEVKNNEEFRANLGLEQYIIDGWLGYASLNWFKNEFRNFDNKFSLDAGVGKELFNDAQHSLKMKLGMAYNTEQYSNNQAEHKFTSLNEYVEYNNKLNEVSKLYVKVGASQNFDDFADYEVLALVGLNFALSQNLSVSIEEEVRYNKISALGFDKTDTKTIVSVEYKF